MTIAEIATLLLGAILVIVSLATLTSARGLVTRIKESQRAAAILEVGEWSMSEEVSPEIREVITRIVWQNSGSLTRVLRTDGRRDSLLIGLANPSEYPDSSKATDADNPEDTGSVSE